MPGGFVTSTPRIRWRGWWEVSSVSSTEQKQICWKLGAENFPFYTDFIQDVQYLLVTQSFFVLTL
jgi:hypothetical protein